MACVVWNDDIYVVVLTPEFMATFTTKPITDPRESAQVAVALMPDSREEVEVGPEAYMAEQPRGTPPRRAVSIRPVSAEGGE